MAGAVLYLAGGSALVLVMAAGAAILDRWLPDGAWEWIFRKIGWGRGEQYGKSHIGRQRVPRCKLPMHSLQK